MRYAVRTPQILLLVVWPLPRSLATTSGISVDFFSSPYLDVSVQAVPHVYLCIQYTLTDSSSAGFPHSEIHGSQAAFALPWLIVDRYVLRRLLVPRHSPYALSSLTIFFTVISHRRTILVRIIGSFQSINWLGCFLDDKYCSFLVYPKKS